MSLIVRHQLPRIVQRNAAEALTLDVYSAASVQQTASAATVTIKLGSTVIVDAAAATSLGPPASYTLAAATTENENLSDQYLEIWTVTISGTVYTFRHSGHLVRHKFYPTIIDTDLTDRDSDLLNIVPSSVTDLSQYREAARKRIERDLLRKGRRPWLIFDSYELVDAHIALSLHFFYSDQAIAIGDGRYREAATAYMDEYKTSMAEVNFRYDSNESGEIDEEDRVAGATVYRLTASNRNPNYRRRR